MFSNSTLPPRLPSKKQMVGGGGRKLETQETISSLYSLYLSIDSSSFIACETSVSPRSSPLGTFREEERLRLSDRNAILMTQCNVYIINPVVMGFQIRICPILLGFWSILVKCCVHLPTSSSKTQMLLLEKTIFHKY